MKINKALFITLLTLLLITSYHAWRGDKATDCAHAQACIPIQGVLGGGWQNAAGVCLSLWGSAFCAGGVSCPAPQSAINVANDRFRCTQAGDYGGHNHSCANDVIAYYLCIG